MIISLKYSKRLALAVVYPDLRFRY